MLKRVSESRHTCRTPTVDRNQSTMLLSNEDTDIDSMITTFNTAVTETASEILGKHRQKVIVLPHMLTVPS